MQRKIFYYPIVVLVVLAGASIITGGITLVVPFTVRDPIRINGGENPNASLILQANTRYEVKIQVQWLEFAEGSGQLVIRDKSQSVIVSLDILFNSREGYGMSSNDFTVPHTGQYSMTFFEESVSASDPFSIWICEKSFMSIPSEILLILGGIFFLGGIFALVFLEFIGDSSPYFSEVLEVGEKILIFIFVGFVINLIFVLFITVIAIFNVPGYLEELITLPTFILVYGITMPLISPILGLLGLGALGALVLVSIIIIYTRGYISGKLGWNERDQKRYILISLSIFYVTPIIAYLMVFYLKQIIDSSVFSFSEVLKDPFSLSFSLEKVFSAWWFFGLIFPFLLAPILISRHFLFKTVEPREL